VGTVVGPLVGTGKIEVLQGFAVYIRESSHSSLIIYIY